MTVEPRWRVPRVWEWTSIDTIAEVTGGGTPSANDPLNFSNDVGIPWVTPADLTGYEDTYIARGKRNLSDRGYRSSSAKLLPAGAVLFTSRAPIGYCAIAGNPIATNQGFKSLTLFGGISGEFTRHYLKWSKPFLESLASGTTFLELSGSKLKQVPFPLPSVAEQKRIVAKLDALNAKSARARTELSRIKVLISRYKQAVLGKAFSGELAGNGSWQTKADVQDHLAGLPGSQGRKLRRGVDQIATKPAYLENFDVPGRWVETYVADLIRLGAIWDVKDGNHGANHPTKEEFSVIGLPFITADRVIDGKIAYDEAAKLNGAPLDKLRVGFSEPGDVILTHKGTVGRAAVATEKSVLSPQTTYYRLNKAVFLPEYFFYFLQSSYLTRQLDDVKSQTTRDFVPIARQYELFVLVPALTEQHEIVRRIESAFAKIDRLAVEAKRALRLLAKMDEAILAKAFCGELVPQDNSEEPAEKLLERISTERNFSLKVKSKRIKRVTNMPAARDFLNTKLETWPSRGVSFQDLKREFGGSYDDLKDAIFASLSDEHSPLQQIFDEETSTMAIRKRER